MFTMILYVIFDIVIRICNFHIYINKCKGEFQFYTQSIYRNLGILDLDFNNEKP